MKANLALVHDSSAPPLSPDNLSDQGGEPRVRDVDLAERLGFADPSMLKRLIERNAGELRTYGAISVTVTENKDPKGRGRPGKVSWLNEGQALVLCALSRTPRAAAVRKQVIDVFVAYRAGRLAPAAPALPPAPAEMALVPIEIMERIVGALEQLASERRPAKPPASGSVPLADRDADELAVLDRFLAAHVRSSPGGRTPVQELYQTYVAWCTVARRELLSDRKFGRLLRHRLERLDGTSRPAFLDVALVDTADLPAPAHAAPPSRAPRALAAPAPAEGALILGARAIGDYLGLTERQVKHAVSIGALPVFRMGNRFRSSKPALDAWIAESARAGRVAR